jgi:D-aminoacyl-tRNA deacylase
MKAILQRVSKSSVVVNDVTIGSIDQGIMALIGFGKDDNESILPVMLEKILNMRIFSNQSGKFDYSLLDINGGLLLIPQFTLYADTSKGRRPEFFSALSPNEARILFNKIVALSRERLGKNAAAGEFGADMKVSLTNDGPVTINIEI